MKLRTTDRGFEILEHDVYTSQTTPPEVSRVAQQSSAIGGYPDSFDKPGSSFLWIGENHHLNREEVAHLIVYLKRWVETGSMS